MVSLCRERVVARAAVDLGSASMGAGWWVLVIVGLILGLNLGPGPLRAAGTQDICMGGVLASGRPQRFGLQTGAGL